MDFKEISSKVRGYFQSVYTAGKNTPVGLGTGFILGIGGILLTGGTLSVALGAVGFLGIIPGILASAVTVTMATFGFGALSGADEREARTFSLPSKQEPEKVSVETPATFHADATVSPDFKNAVQGQQPEAVVQSPRVAAKVDLKP